MSFFIHFIILFLVSLLCSATGFIKFLYFISIGYGLSVAAMGLTLLIIFEATTCTKYLCILLIIYGIRLSGYIYYREITSKFSEITNTGKKTYKDFSLPFVIMMWTTCALLYIAMISPVFFRMENRDEDDILSYIGGIISLIGILLESVADYQKYMSKKKDPYMYVSHGLYKIVRCPNFLGEVICWVGYFISGITSFKGNIQWISSIVGLFCIIEIMFAGSKRLEIRQDKTHGDKADYITYKNSTPILIPFIPLYSLKKYTWLVG